MVDLNNIKLPFIVKDRKLFVSGFHNGEPFHLSDIKAAFQLTNWKDDRITSIYLDHRDGITHDSYGNEKVGTADVRDYVGGITNIKLKGGSIVGDVEIVDMPTAIKLAYAKSRFGISPFGGWKDGKPMIRDFALVVDPAQGTKTEIGKNFAMSHKNNFTLKTETKMDFEDMKDAVAEMITPLKAEIVSLNKELTLLKEKDVKAKPSSGKDTKDEDSLDDKVKAILAQREKETSSLKELSELKKKVETLETEKLDFEKVKKELESKISETNTDVVDDDNVEDDTTNPKDNGETIDGTDPKADITDDTPADPKGKVGEVSPGQDTVADKKIGIQESNSGMVDFLKDLGTGV